MAIDPRALWNFNEPAQSEQRFRSALSGASAEDQFILHTQIARTYGLRKEFTRSQEILRELESTLANASVEAQAWYWLELGRSLSSGTHSSESQTADTKARARQAYEHALAAARSGGFDGLAIDALHMLAFVDTAPADQLKWGEEALSVALASSQPAAVAWRASLRNNIGYALHQLGRFEEALAQFQEALALREQKSDIQATRIARWMVAWTLRAMERTDEALAIQLRLEAERAAAGTPSSYVFGELELLYLARGDEARAAHYAGLKMATSQ
ncbi:MAG TPA: tetratricopeptide repeat protein [Caldimonas sp.]|nr:tetratricopeptide repeat protein [Caldimonas sp.]